MLSAVSHVNTSQTIGSIVLKGPPQVLSSETTNLLLKEKKKGKKNPTLRYSSILVKVHN